MREAEFYRTFEHTADLGIETWGEDLESLFINAARAIFTEMTGGLPAKSGKGPIYVKASALNTEELFVRWLEELLFLSATKEMVFTRFEISKLGETDIETKAWGVAFSEAPPELEIKAVTYHELKIEKTDEGFKARFVADI